MSDTPLTDQVEHDYTYPGCGDIDEVFKVMRKFERELAERTQTVLDLNELAEMYYQQIAELKRELAEAKRDQIEILGTQIFHKKNG